MFHATGIRLCRDRLTTCARSFMLILAPFVGSVVADDGTERLASQVTIRRDTFGVPHILADTEEAAAFGQGYAVAEDHILELARLFLKARSEEAAWFGERFAEPDLSTKELSMHEGAETGYRTLPPWVQMILAGYAAGYNRYVDQHRLGLPDWVQPCTGIDVLAHARRVILMEFSLDLRQLRDIRPRGSRQS